MAYLREKPMVRLSVGLVLANCCDFVIVDPPVFTVVLSSQTVSGQKLRKIVRYFGLAQKGISYKIAPIIKAFKTSLLFTLQ